MTTPTPSPSPSGFTIKESTLPFILTLLIQFGGFAWWAATLTTKLDNLTAQVVELKTEKYTTNDAKRDNALMQSQIDDLSRRMLMQETKRK